VNLLQSIIKSSLQPTLNGFLTQVQPLSIPYTKSQGEITSKAWKESHDISKSTSLRQNRTCIRDFCMWENYWYLIFTTLSHETWSFIHLSVLHNFSLETLQCFVALSIDSSMIEGSPERRNLVHCPIKAGLSWWLPREPDPNDLIMNRLLLCSPISMAESNPKLQVHS
jgi:hypothetical protein